jgi:putative ABC transport system ATP-binding protein
MILLSDKDVNPDMVSSPPLINLKSVNLSLPSLAGTVDILKNVSLSINAGETVAILGPSGSGKSSLMALMTGLEQASSGVVDIAGQDFTKLDEDGLALARRGRLGIVLQAFHLVPTMTALENVAVPLELNGTANAFEVARAELEQVGLGHRVDHYPAQLSGGEQQRVAIARAAAPKPPLLFADEPTGNLDGHTGKAIVDLLFAHAAARGTTLVIITHDVGLAALCKRTVRLDDGHIVEDRLAA